MKNEQIKIYTLSQCPSVGSQGEDTRIRYGDCCPVCKRDPAPIIDYLEYSVDWWDGEDLLSAGDVYCVTPRLRDALEGAGVTGIAFREMKTTRSQYLQHRDPEHKICLPVFSELVVLTECSAGSGWLKRIGVCDGCHQTLWEYTSKLAEGITAAAKGKVGPPRSVYFSSWDGEDVFNLDDGGPPVVTQRFVDLVKKLNLKAVQFDPALWVDGECE